MHAHGIGLPSDFLATEAAAITEQPADAQVGDVFGALLALRRVGALLPSPDRAGRSRIDPLVRAWWSRLESEMLELGRPELFVAGALQRGVWLTRSGASDAALTVLAECAAQKGGHRLPRNQAGLHFARGLALAATGGRSGSRRGCWRPTTTH